MTVQVIELHEANVYKSELLTETSNSMEGADQILNVDLPISGKKK